MGERFVGIASENCVHEFVQHQQDRDRPPPHSALPNACKDCISTARFRFWRRQNGPKKETKARFSKTEIRRNAARIAPAWRERGERYLTSSRFKARTVRISAPLARWIA